jgi:hypothetical protein
MSRFILTLALLGSLLSAATSHAAQPYVVSEASGGQIWRIVDSNGDGDALDVGERTLWADGFVAAREMATDSLAVYVTETGLAAGSNYVVRLIDSNSDGDALDAGERAIWSDGLGYPVDISFDRAGAWYVSDYINNQLWRIVDSNGDNDVLDAGEKTLFAQGIAGPIGVLQQAGALLVTAYDGNQIHRLSDNNGDGDALDAAENLVITPLYAAPYGIADDRGGGFYFSSYTTDTLYQARDRNGDGDMLDVAEVLSYADSVYGGLDGPAGLTPFAGGGLLLADWFNNQVKRIRDANGDGDALDVGDVLLFADGIDQPVDIVALPPRLPGDFNHEGSVNAADYVQWRKRLGTIYTQDDYSIWRTHFGLSFGDAASAGATGSASAAIPEPTSLIPFAISAVGIASSSRRRKLR